MTVIKSETGIRVDLSKTQIKELKPILEKAKEINQPPFDGGNMFVIVGQVKIPDNVNKLKAPALEVTLLTGPRANRVTQSVLKEFKNEYSL